MSSQNPCFASKGLVMISTSYRQECLCSWSFDNTGAFTRHNKTCLKGKKRLANVLNQAQESYYHRKRCCVEESPSSSQTRFQDMLPEPPLPLPPHGAEVLLEVNALEADPGSCPSTSAASVTPNSQPSSFEDPAAQRAQLPSKRCAILVTPKNSFGVFRLYNEGSIPSTDDPEDQSGANPLTTPGLEACASQPLPSFVNPFHPYPNESSWRIGDWYWNEASQAFIAAHRDLQGAQLDSISCTLHFAPTHRCTDVLVRRNPINCLRRRKAMATLCILRK